MPELMTLTPAELELLREIQNKRKKKRPPPYANPARPEKPRGCKGCMWGERLADKWTYCPFQSCVKKKL